MSDLLKPDAGSPQLATLCYINRGQEVLMLHRNKNAKDLHIGKWNGLGGKCEPGESPRECVIREVREESGLNIFFPKLRGVLTFPEFAKGRDWIVFVYSVSDFEGNLVDSVEGSLEWVRKDAVYTLPLWPGDHYFLPLVFKEQLFEGKFVYDKSGNGVLIDHEITVY